MKEEQMPEKVKRWVRRMKFTEALLYIILGILVTVLSYWRFLNG